MTPIESTPDARFPSRTRRRLTLVLGGVCLISAVTLAVGPTLSGHANLQSRNDGSEGGDGALILANADESVASLPPPSVKRSLKVKRGDTLMSIMVGAGIDRQDAHDAIIALKSVYDPRELMPGQRITLTVSPDDELEAVRIEESAERRVAALREEDSRFKAVETQKTLQKKVFHSSGVIKSSLYAAAVKANVPPNVLAELIRIYSWDVDFQREVQPGDRFELAYERFVDEDGDPVRFGKIVYAALTLSGDFKPLYRFAYEPNRFDYFDDKGRGAKKALMRTPIDGARLSSRFGKRRHPVLGYTKVHRGVDFAAPTGTPIYAAGDGVITYRGTNGAYGKFIELRHNTRYSTGYAHMSSFKSGVTRGSRVRQGQIIGYVGSTGRSTGPHLHYEIRVAGKQVNPLTVKMPAGRQLDKKSLARFHAERAIADRLIAGLRKATEISQR